MERENVFHLCPTPTVNRLIVIPHNAQVAVFRGECFDDAVLAGVGVLVFVDQQVVEAIGFLAPIVVVFMKEFLR